LSVFTVTERDIIAMAKAVIGGALRTPKSRHAPSTAAARWAASSVSGSQVTGVAPSLRTASARGQA